MNRAAIATNDKETLLLIMPLLHEQDVVSARQRAREIAELFGFDRQDQSRFTTAVSEIARNAYEYASGGKIAFFAVSNGKSALSLALLARISDTGPGIANLNEILGGSYVSKTGMGLGITGARRLCDRFDIKSSPGQGTVVDLEKNAPRRGLGKTPLDTTTLLDKIAGLTPRNPFAEVRQQNQELLHTLNELQSRQTELDQLNRELSDTNRGVMALYAELDEKAKELQNASDMKTRFLSDMSHEFRTPLNSIMGLARLLLEHADGPLVPEQEKQITFIHRSAQTLSEIVNDLLDTAKIEAGKITVQPETVIIDDLFSALRGVFRPLVGNGTDLGAVSLFFEPTFDLPPLFTDESKVAQILRNLISNALKFTSQGSVRVSATMELEADAAKAQVRFAVADTGIGIAPADIDRIFDAFAQVDGAAQRNIKGTGLGLPLCRKLAEILGGHVWVESTIGVGSTFVLRLPVRYAPVSADLNGGIIHG